MTDPVRRFRGKRPDELRDPDLNPYLKIHQDYGPPVITAELAPGFKGRWAEAFDGRLAPLHVEVGAGNGFFLSGFAGRHPEYNLLGIEIRYKRVIQCARKIQAAGVSNARIIRYDAWSLDDLFLPASLDGIYVHHPDPWPKEKQVKHRLMSLPFAQWAARALKPGSALRLKTDALHNVEGLLAAIEGLPFEVLGRSDFIARDGAPWGEDDVRTNYQSKFDKRGEPVLALWLGRREEPARIDAIDGEEGHGGR